MRVWLVAGRMDACVRVGWRRHDGMPQRKGRGEDPVIRLTLPEPPSANRYYRMAGRHMHRSSEAQAYTDRVEDICDQAGVVPIRGPVGVRFTWYRGRRSGDLDNLRVGLDTEVRFPGLRERSPPIIHGRVTRISADSFTVEETGASYFRAD